MHALKRRSPRLLIVTVILGLLAAVAVAYAATPTPAIQTVTPTKADKMTNIDVLRQQIKNYYGAPMAATGATGTWADALNPDSNYAKEAIAVTKKGAAWLAHHAGKSANQAIILDVDDTTLATWNYELYSNWDYNPATNADFVLNGRFPAVPGMVALVNQAKTEGYAIVFLTGRPATQEAATLANLTKAGVDYPAPTALPAALLGGGSDGIFTKPAIVDYPPYLVAACATELASVPAKSCTTIHYKSATRAYLVSLGYDIVADFGDQYSDLVGGSADKTFKLPNPNYYLP